MSSGTASSCGCRSASRASKEVLVCASTGFGCEKSCSACYVERHAVFSTLRCCLYSYCTILNCTALFSTLRYYALLLLYYSLLYGTILCSEWTFLFYTVLFSTLTVRFSTRLFYTVRSLLFSTTAAPPAPRTWRGAIFFIINLLFFTLLCYTLLHCIILYYTTLFSTLLYYSLLYCTILDSTVIFATRFYYSRLYFTILDSTVLFSTLLYNSLLYCTILDSTVLFYYSHSTVLVTSLDYAERISCIL